MPNKADNNLRLIMKAASRIESLINHFIFHPAGLTSASFQILRILNAEGDKNQGELLERLGSTKSNITQRLQNLEKKGLIARLSQDDDKRRLTISLTGSGKAKIDSIIEQMEKAEVHIEKYFGEQELAEHHAFFTKLNNLLNICETNAFKNYEEHL